LIIVSLIVVLVLVFAVQNLSPNQVQFLGWDWYVPTIVLLLITFVVGLIAGWILAAFGKRRQGREEKEAKEAGSAGR